MKKNLLAAFCLLTLAANAQIIHERVHFDNPSDQSDHFYGMQSLVQIPTGGITGGCLAAADSNNWGNDNSRYCSKFRAIDTTYSVFLSFYYADSIMSASSFDRATSIWLQPSADPNHYVIGSLNHSKKLELITYYSADYSGILPLVNGNWYLLFSTITIANDSARLDLELSDLGPGGVSTPVSIGTVSARIQDTVLVRDSAIEISITGSRAGGGIYIDDFGIDGIKSADSCLNTGVSTLAEDGVVILNGEGFLRIKSAKILKTYTIYDLTGKKVLTRGLSSERIIDTSSLNKGIYLLRFDGIDKTYKITLQ